MSDEGDVIQMCECTCVKVSVQMPEELITAVCGLVGTGGFSQYVTEAVDRRHRRELLGEWIEEFEAAHGPINAELMNQAVREWPDFEEG